jgi:hypothetical protein
MSDQTLTTTLSAANFTSIVNWINGQIGPTGAPLFQFTNDGWNDLVSKNVLPKITNSVFAPTNVEVAKAAQAAATAYYDNAISPGLNGFVGFTISAAGLSAATGGSPATTTLTLAYLSGFTGTIVLSALAPTGVTVTFSTSSFTSGGTSTVTVTVAGGMSNAVVGIALVGTCGTVTNRTIISLTITGGTSSGTYANGPYTATNPGAMVVSSNYALTLTYALPSGVAMANINWWSIWFVAPANAPSNSSGVNPAPTSAAVDIRPNDPNQILAWQNDGINANAYAIGASVIVANSQWVIAAVTATLASSGGVVTLTLPNVAFSSAATYHLYMRVNYTDPATSLRVDQAGNAGEIYIDLGSYAAS